MGVWDDQYWPSQAEVEKIKEERNALAHEYREIDRKFCAIKAQGVRYSDTRRLLAQRKTHIAARLREMNALIKRVNIENQHELIRQAGIDTTDSRSLLTVALSEINRLKGKIVGLGGKLEETDNTVTNAISMYLQYRSRAPQGKLAFVPAQVEHRGRGA